GARPFESALTVQKISVRINGAGELPKPDSLTLGRPWKASDNYRWVFAEGAVKFHASDGDGADLEVFTGRSLIHVRALHWNRDVSKRLRESTNLVVRVEGVCEGIQDPNGTMTPGLIWAPAQNSISLITSPATNEIVEAESQHS